MHEESKKTENQCGNCKHFKRHEYENLDVVCDYGECRRYPPRRISENISLFPFVIDDCVCGEWTTKS